MGQILKYLNSIKKIDIISMGTNGKLPWQWERRQGKEEVLKLQQLRYFEAACRYHSITAAAEALHVSQPSISMAIRELEEEFDVKLTIRRYQGFTLTEEGEALWEMGASLLRHADQVERYMNDFSEEHHVIRIGIPPMVGTLVLPELYGGFLGEYPQVRLTTREQGTKTLLQELLDNQLDLAFVTHSGPLEPDFRTVRISQTETVWCVAPDHPLAGKSQISMEQLAGEPLVFFQSSFSQHELVMRRFQEARVTPQVLHETEQLSTVHSLIQSGTASGFLLRFLAEKLPGVRWVRLDPPVPVEIRLAWDRRRKLTPDMRRLARWWQGEA